jgi:hypothetical protein
MEKIVAWGEVAARNPLFAQAWNDVTVLCDSFDWRGGKAAERREQRLTARMGFSQSANRLNRINLISRSEVGVILKSWQKMLKLML